MLFNPNTIDEACVQAINIESEEKKGQPNICKQTKQHNASNKGLNNKGRRKNKNIATTSNMCKNPNNHYDHYNIDGQSSNKRKMWETTSRIESQEPQVTKTQRRKVF